MADPTVTPEMVEQLAKLAEIELDDERRGKIAAELDGLLSDANEVNRFMDARRDVAPAIVFHHRELHEDE
jgi:Asp-tRNA(Asn)/Glu-tRNA(Gln) amidotransferase C subunit